MSMGWWRRSSKRQVVGHSDVADGLADECEAFLAGKYLFQLASTGQPIPGWALINPLAHGDPALIRWLADVDAGPSDPLALLSYLADEVLLAAARQHVPLEVLQQAVLVPLESQAELLPLKRPRELVALVRKGLELPTHGRHH
jgi:hypothetical protein